MAAAENCCRPAGVDFSSSRDLLRYLDGLGKTQLAQVHKLQTIRLLDVQKGHRVLEVGCGPGDDVRKLAQLVGQSGRVVGIDISETLISEARKRASGRKLPVELCVGDVHNLTLPSGTFDRCRADRVFMHLENPAQALSEIVRVAKLGAKIVVSEPDWETVVIDAPDRRTTRAILNFICDYTVKNGWMGRQLVNLFKGCGLTEVAVMENAFSFADFSLADQILRLRHNSFLACQAAVVTKSEADNWLESLQEASRHNRFYGSIMVYTVCGNRA